MERPHTRSTGLFMIRRYIIFIVETASLNSRISENRIFINQRFGYPWRSVINHFGRATSLTTLLCKPGKISHALLESKCKITLLFFAHWKPFFSCPTSFLPFSTISLRIRTYKILQRRDFPLVSVYEFYTIELGLDILCAFFYKVHEMTP